ncbi:uncharacterized protein LOC123717086 [Pieris brassicae]|uniref:uncharacterized protein LOC123717086 n=1 Tax=Pieris brassicae TaxID=7116 RepID=UPI001E66242F|nr:uncharacterized protein LOC123717086 [Pieris brassicae]XP_045528843.1 uncharacterized protein LOC123717086 [Pieris brassicae]
MDATIILKGNNLGKRHQYFNHLVKEYCYKDKIFESLPKTTPIDKILKIDVANHHKHVAYIIKTLKNDDMLYVSRALKSYWLLNFEYSYIINPVYLETNLFPEMSKPGVNKMKHWIKANLKDPQRCEEFYTYYKNDFEDSIKYLKSCSSLFIINQVGNIIEKLTPKHLKVLCQICPTVAKAYFECLLKNNNAIMKYRECESEFFESFKCILKLDGNLYLELIESYYTQGRLSSTATQYIVKNFKINFLAKQELYTSQILDVNTLATCLTPNECRDLVFNLAKAEYLQDWFSYKSVEPLIKRLSLEERACFKKLIFIDKAVGEKVKEWPYKKPECPYSINITDNIFDDEEYNNYEYDYYEDEEYPKIPRMLVTKKSPRYCLMHMHSVVKKKTLLDQLFDKYRFAGFFKTYAELKNRLQAESTIEGRQNILLVLISKSGGVFEHVETLMKLLTEKHKNEPSNLRATVVRSLIKRLKFWRVPEDTWSLMLTFAHGLGLDGHDGNPLCIEGLHAVILRSILNGTTPTSDLMKAYYNHFTTFKDFGLKGSEVMQVKKHLPTILQGRPKEFVDVVSTYKIKDIANLEDNLAKSAIGNEDLINSLFDKRIARRQLIAETFPIKQFEASYINALRHDPSLLGDGVIFASLAVKEKTNHDRFLRTLKIYFGEEAGLADQHLAALSNALNIAPKSSLVRPIAMLSSTECIIKKIDELRRNKTNADLKLASRFQNSVHTCKPHINIDKVDWKILGLKAVGNNILISKSSALEHNIKSCLQRNETFPLALKLALNTAFEVETFTFVVVRRPKIALQVAVSYYFNASLTMPPEMWKIVKEIILTLDYNKLPRKVLKHLAYIHKSEIPKNIEADYWTTVYQARMRVKREKAMPALCMVEKLLDKVDKDVVTKIVNDFIKNDITVKNLTNYDNLYSRDIEVDKPSDVINNNCMCLYMRIIAKYLVFATSSEEQCEIIKNTLNPFFDHIEIVWQDMEDKSYIINCLDAFLKSLKCTRAFKDPRYVSCELIFTTVTSRLSSFMVLKEYLYQYMKINFTQLYCSAIKSALKQNPHCFEGNDDKSEAMHIVGNKFGELIGNGIVDLVSEYFFSIIEIYKEGLRYFISEYIPYKESRLNFIATVTRGILKIDKLEAYLVAENLYREYKSSWMNSKDITETLRSCKYQEIKYFLSHDNFAVSNHFY